MEKLEDLQYPSRHIENKKESVNNLNENYYGGLNLLKHENKYYWCIENHDTDFENLEEWNEITEKLYNTIKEEIKKPLN